MGSFRPAGSELALGRAEQVKDDWRSAVRMVEA